MGTYKVRILTPEQADAKYATKGELAAVVGGEDGSGGVAVWGSVIGVLADQPDLVAALNARQAKLVPGTGVTIDESDPLHPIITAAVTAADLSGKQNQLVAGAGIVIDVTDPLHPVISATASGASGPIVLDANQNAIITEGGFLTNVIEGNYLPGYAVMAGRWARISGESSTAVGNTTEAAGWDSSAFGNGAAAMEEYTLAAGNSANAHGVKSVALGPDAQALGKGSLAMSGGLAQAPDSIAILGPRVINGERAVLGVRDLQLARQSGRDPLGQRPNGLQTGIIMTDSNGAKWRVTVSTSGTIAIAADTSLTTLDWTFQSSAGSFQNWTAIRASNTGQYAIAA